MLQGTSDIIVACCCICCDQHFSVPIETYAMAAIVEKLQPPAFVHGASVCNAQMLGAW